MPETKWNSYSASWSMPEAERLERLAEVASPDVTYTDPHISLAGIAAFSDYMAGFQESAPGAGFAIVEAFEHHQRSLSRWNMIDQTGAVIGTGISFAEVSEDGKFESITGFFGPA